MTIDTTSTARWTVAIAVGQIWIEQLIDRDGIMESRGRQRLRKRLIDEKRLVAVLKIYEAHGATWVQFRGTPPSHPQRLPRRRELLESEFRDRFAPCGVTRPELVS